MAALKPHFGSESLETGGMQALGNAAQHAERNRRAKKTGYLHQNMHLVSGLNRRVAESVPEGTALYLVGEGHVVHAFDPEQVQRRGIRIVTVDRDLPDEPPEGVDAQVRCDLIDIARGIRMRTAALDFGGLPQPGTFMASHIGRYLPHADTDTLVGAGAQALPEGGTMWIIDTPMAAQRNKLGGSPGFEEAYDLASRRGDVRIAIDEVIAPVLALGLYYRLNDMRAARPGSDDFAFFDAVENGDVRFDAVPADRAREEQFRVHTGKRSVRVNGWGIRAMMLEKR